MYLFMKGKEKKIMLDLIVVMKEYYIALAVFIAIGAAGRMADWF